MKYLLGPELYWAGIFGLALMIQKINKSSVQWANEVIVSAHIYVPMFTALVFILFFLPGVEKHGLLLRIWIASLVGGHFVLDRLVKSHSEQGPGVGMVYISGMIFLFLILIVGSVFIKMRWPQA